MSEAAAAGGAGALARPYRWAGFAIGFGLGGFFDGILLHQVLQWHHLLSGLQSARFQDIRVQILGDGLFHLVMYVVTAAGLVLLWRTRSLFARTGAERRLLADALVGFGVWHVLDGVLSHWVLGIHRIRMDVGNPMVWDLLWFLVFGVAFIAAGWLIGRGAGRGPGRGGVPLALALVAVTSGAIAALPPPDAALAVVLFRPGVALPQAFAALDDLDARIVWTDPSRQVWAVDLPDGASAGRLFAEGAIFVSRSLLPAGCFNWVRS